jgi:SagB-type dehydrogenase family enzyme
MNKREIIRAYHERTKHRLDAYARGPEYLDWDSQPDPFRRYAGSPLISLPFNPDPSNQSTVPLDKDGISKLLELSMGLSAWKQFGPDRWALRCNPSSGNLHPTEAYVVCNQVDSLDDGVYHYAPEQHGLERRAELISNSSESYCLLGLTSIAWREAWKYGERAFRYVQLDVGHALGAMRYAAGLLGWQVSLRSIGDSEISELLGLSRKEDFEAAETEQPDLLLQIHPSEKIDKPVSLPNTTHWMGQANPLGGDPYLKWPVIDEAHHACIDETPDYPPPLLAAKQTQGSTKSLAKLIRQRRSAQSFIGKQSSLALDLFADFLKALLPNSDNMPWDLWSGRPRLHLALFVHRVEGLSPGLYALPRHKDALPLLRDGLSDKFQWGSTCITTDELPIYCLTEGDSRKLARMLSCHQEIASTSSFSFSMLADFDQALETTPSAYRHLHWEAGLIGQAAYLEAEKIGMRGTGIGCFFDDSVHESLGITDTHWQSLYHFTVGFPRIDQRLQTLEPYAHLVENLEI